VVVSGDLTQRAKTAEFSEAREFLDALPSPQVVVPGNHDVPLYNLFRRFWKPLQKYQRHITGELTPAYADEEMLILGLNTARSLTIKGGRINREQIEWVGEQFCAAPASITKVLVTHHPFDGPETAEGDIVGRARLAMERLAECGADLLLSGHLHNGQIADTSLRYNTGARSPLVVQAGTATSSRGRGEANSYNMLSIDPGMVLVERYAWQPDSGEFGRVEHHAFTRAETGWKSV
jgi:3',5'-cyclic AMP phosphodiesterase CpdA